MRTKIQKPERHIKNDRVSVPRKSKGKIIAGLVATTLASTLVCQPAAADVLCKNASGALYVRGNACKKKETQVSPYSIGAVGAQGPRGPQGLRGAQGVPGPQGIPGSARAWALIDPNGHISTQGGSVTVTWTVTKVATGEYCLATSPNLFGNYDPVVATIHGQDKTFGQISVNTEFGSDCNPYGGHGVFTANTSGTAADQWFLVAIL